MVRRYGNRVLPRGLLVDRGFVWIRLHVNGRLVRECFGKVSKPGVFADAEAKLGRYRDQIRSGKFGFAPKAKRITVEEACDVYWELHGSKKKSAGDFERILKRIKKFFRDRYFDSVTYLDVQDYRRWREKGVSPSSANRDHTVITHLFNALKEWRRLGVIDNIVLPEENPGSLVKRANEKPFRRKRVLSPDELNRFLAVADPKVVRICLAAVHTALRRKDLKALTKSHVNDATGQLEGIQAKTGKPYAVPITDVMKDIIATAPDNKLLDFKNFIRLFRAARKKSGVQFQFRDLRRTSGRMMLQQGVDLATVSSYLGHTTLGMTEAYVQAEREHKQAAGKVISSIFRPSPTPSATE